MSAGQPFWDEADVVASWSGLPALKRSVTADLCVVGLGASGLAAVEWGVDRGLSVVGIDAGRVASGAAGRNAGFLLGGSALVPHELAERWGDERAADLYRATLAEIDRLVDTLGPFVVRRTGSIRLAGSPGRPDQAELDDCERHMGTLVAAGIAAEAIDTTLGPALLLPDDAVVNPALRCLLTVQTLVSRAALYEGTPAVSIEAGRVRTEHGEVSAAAVVVCVDGGLEWVVPALASRVRTARLNVLATDPVPPVLPWPVYSRWGWDYAQQLPDGRLVVGGGRDLADGDWITSQEAAADTVTAHVQVTLEELAWRLADREVTVSHRWTGLAAFTEDRLPICELVDEGVAVAGAYSGVGNLIGPITARTACALATQL